MVVEHFELRKISGLVSVSSAGTVPVSVTTDSFKSKTKLILKLLIYMATVFPSFRTYVPK